MPNKKVVVKTGEKVKVSGIYRKVGLKTEVVLTTDDRVPPTKDGSQKLVLVRAAKHPKQ